MSETDKRCGTCRHRCGIADICTAPLPYWVGIRLLEALPDTHPVDALTHTCDEDMDGGCHAWLPADRAERIAWLKRKIEELSPSIDPL